ncbi:hypothetical protein ACFSC4_11920 [Deinococcus malanensis]|uniref:hypothetical protein n=1 Tax=Deinococcus malanensis TaxID=1706855 RepID=UPI00362AE380
MRRASGAAQVGDVKTVDVNYLDRVQRVLIANSEGLWAEDERVQSRLSVSAIAQDGTLRQSGFTVRAPARAWNSSTPSRPRALAPRPRASPTPCCAQATLRPASCRS